MELFVLTSEVPKRKSRDEKPSPRHAGGEPRFGKLAAAWWLPDRFGHIVVLEDLRAKPVYYEP